MSATVHLVLFEFSAACYIMAGYIKFMLCERFKACTYCVQPHRNSKIKSKICFIQVIGGIKMYLTNMKYSIIWESTRYIAIQFYNVFDAQIRIMLIFEKIYFVGSRYSVKNCKFTLFLKVSQSTRPLNSYTCFYVESK